MTEKIDLAFVDRADIKQYIGPPSLNGIYSIYLSCLEELMKVRRQPTAWICIPITWLQCPLMASLAVYFSQNLPFFFFFLKEKHSMKFQQSSNFNTLLRSSPLPVLFHIGRHWQMSQGTNLRVFIPCSVKSSTHGSSCSPSLSWRRWGSLRVRCLNTACTWGTSLCECIRLLCVRVCVEQHSHCWQPAAHGPSFCVCRKSKGLSGRALRKLPFLAHALFVKVKPLPLGSHCAHKQEHSLGFFPTAFFLLTVTLFYAFGPQAPTVVLAHFLSALDRAVDKQKQERSDLVNGVWTWWNCPKAEWLRDCSVNDLFTARGTTSASVNGSVDSVSWFGKTRLAEIGRVKKVTNTAVCVQVERLVPRAATVTFASLVEVFLPKVSILVCC